MVLQITQLGVYMVIVSIFFSYISEPTGFDLIDTARPLIAYITARFLFFVLFPTQSKVLSLCRTARVNHASRLEAAAILNKHALKYLRKGIAKAQADRQ